MILTWDRGREIYDLIHLPRPVRRSIYASLKPGSGQGTSKNTNHPLRQYLPKNADLRRFTQNDLDVIALELVMAPQDHQVRSPAEVCAEHLNGGDARGC